MVCRGFKGFGVVVFVVVGWDRSEFDLSVCVYTLGFKGVK